MKKYFTLLAALCLPWVASAENVLTLSEVTAEAGGQAVLSIELENDIDIAAFGAYLMLPEGVSIVEDEAGDAFVMEGRASQDGLDVPMPRRSVVQHAIYEEGYVKFAFVVMSYKYVITPGKGTVLTVPLKIDERVETGNYEISLKNVELSTYSPYSSETVFLTPQQQENYLITADDYVTVQNVVSEKSAVLEVKGKGDTTGIGQIQTEGRQTATGIYDLTGRKVQSPAKGLYIVNGKKRLMR